nr:unnamed protein product [Callosobruchus analis]
MFTRKRDLHEHTIRKHPHLIATITSKLHKCTYCAYQTVLKPNFDRHLLTHPETVNNYKFQICVRCNAKFRNKSSLDDHTVKKHPDFVASVSRKLYECTQCTFKTVTKAYLDRHMSKHSADSHNLSLCIHCNVTFKSKKSLDEHTVRKHLDLVESLSVKVYKCAHCSYKTTLKTSLHRHMSQHPETEGGSNLIICGHCNITFKSKQTLDDHTIRTHPDFIASVSGKIHECTYCTYKTSVKSHFDRHIMKHSNNGHNSNICVHCNTTYKSKKTLDDHTVRKHRQSTALISRKIYECTCCAFKTVMKSNLARHMLKHPELADSDNLSRCIHCKATYKSKTNLDDHTLKQHPDFIATVSSKLHKCTYCTYQTTIKFRLTQHLNKHAKTKLSKKSSEELYRCCNCDFTTTYNKRLIKHMKEHKSRNSSDIYGVRFMCTDCNAKFTNKKNFDNHTLRKHPHLIATITRKLHKCTYCAYQTVLKANFDRHLLTHPETVNKYKFKICVHCNAKFKHKFSLDDHTLRTHPDFIASLSCKVYECPCCPYKSVAKAKLDRHMLIHNETANKFKMAQFMCTDCNAIFTNKKNLDDHTLRKHPHLIATITRKLHKCTYCAYQTVLKANFDRHLLTHPETVNNYKFKICVHCNAKFRKKGSLDDHTLRKHPDCMASFSCKVYKCAHCTAKFKHKFSLDDHTLRKHPDFIASLSCKVYDCPCCPYKTVAKAKLDRHMLIHNETAKFMCTACNAIFTTERILDDHRVRKHPHLIATINRKLHKCIYCAYQTILKANCDRHVLTHLETGNNYKFNICVHCNAKFKRKASLDDHTLRKHPDFMASVSCKVYECAHCTYKTVMKATLVRHMVKHPEKALNYNFSICVHCNAAYNSKPKLDEHIVMKSNLTQHMTKHTETADIYKLRCKHCDETFKRRPCLDEHVIRIHPHLIPTVTSKIHECSYCAYQTVRKHHFVRHMLKHRSYNLSVCLHCNAKYKSKQLLDYHILRKHPNAIASVSSKIHECTHCTYKTTLKSNFSKHMLKHSEADPEAANNHKFQICVHCNAKHRSKQSLDEHVIRKHPNFISSITSKLHQCTYCTYKSTLRTSFAKHMLKHPETFQICVHCNAKHKSKRSLDEHVIRKHPNSVASITSKIHECTYCTYKSTVSTSLAKHMLKHPEAVNNCKFQICVHCNAKFKNKISLDNHTIRYHPNFVAAVTSKVHECPCCTYKTTLKGNLHKHMLIHPEAVNNYKFQICIHCNAKFKNKISLDNHTIRYHPNFVASVTRKVHECPCCTYKTTLKGNLHKHMLIHPEAVNVVHTKLQ